MKTAISVLSSLLLATGALAQEASVESPKETVAAAAERQRKIQAEERAKTLLEKKPVTYGGYVTDLSRAEKKSRFFSLRQPRDKGDVKNISVDERTGRSQGSSFFVWDSESAREKREGSCFMQAAAAAVARFLGQLPLLPLHPIH